MDKIGSENKKENTVFLTFLFEKVRQKALCAVVKPKYLWHLKPWTKN